MNFVSIRIITTDIRRLARFYEQITGISVKMYTDDFGELKMAARTLAIGSTRTLQLFGGEWPVQLKTTLPSSSSRERCGCRVSKVGGGKW